MIALLNNAWKKLTHDPVLEAAQKGLDKANRLHLGQSLVIDPDALHVGVEVGQRYEFGYNKLENVCSIYQGVKNGKYVHHIDMNPNAKVGSHRHRLGNDEHWKVYAGSVRLMWGDHLENATTLSAGQSFTIPGSSNHAAVALPQGAKAKFSIDKKAN